MLSLNVRVPRSRLRKLRAEEGEAGIAGAELSARLRRHKTQQAKGSLAWAARKRPRAEVLFPRPLPPVLTGHVFSLPPY